MKVVKKDLMHGTVAVGVQNLDDLWHLSQIIEHGDTVKGKTTRKIKAGGKEEVAKKTMTLSILVEEAEFTDSVLRVGGTVNEENEDVPKGSHHSITVEEGGSITITKQKWGAYHLKRLEDATKKQSTTLIVVLDREEAVLAALKSQGYEILVQLHGKVAKKGVDSVTTNFYKEIAEQTAAYTKRLSAERIIIASPAFWKEELLSEIDASIRGKVVLATCSSVGTNAIEEVLKRPELREALREQRAAEEALLVEELMVGIAKESGLSAYGKKEVGDAVSAGNVRVLLITTAFIAKNRSAGEKLMQGAESVQGTVAIVNSENEAGQKLDSLGGIGVLARYKAY